MTGRLTFLYLLRLFLIVECDLFWNFPRTSKEAFHAYVNEKAHTIQVFPSIQVKLTDDSKLCSISLLASGRNNVPNFVRANVLNQAKGYGYLTFNETLYHMAESFGTLEARTGFYHLRIIAEDCSNPPKFTPSWPITFEHIRSDLPIWSKRKYIFEIDSLHKPGHEIGKVTAYSSALTDSNNNNNNSLYGDDTGMCAYAIQDSSYSFTINGHGVIRSLIRFNNHTDTLFEFNVTAFDCHLPVPYSSTVPVTVYVKAACISQWTGIPKEIAYSALSNPYPIALNAKFSICPQQSNNYTSQPYMNADDNKSSDAYMEYDYCPIEQVTVRVKILWSKEDIIVNNDDDIREDQTVQPSSETTTATTTSSSTECDLDYYSILANRRTCIGSTQTKIIDLLPNMNKQQHEQSLFSRKNDNFNLSLIHTTTDQFSALSPYNANNYPTGIFYFNGSTHVDLNKYQKFPKFQRFDNQLFTINFWMKHSPTFNRQYEQNLINGRENILCSSDEYEKNRHHFAVFLHNCKLVVLVRREPPTNESSSTIASDSSQLLPSQWRFDVDEVCDSNWHHYSLTYRPPEMTTTITNRQSNNTSTFKLENDIELQLYLDGQLVPNTPELVKIAENMPMVHLSARNHELVRTSVGACWHGRSTQFVQHFMGYLAGLTFTNGYIQSDEESLCLTNCEPRLIINDPTSFDANTDRFDATNIRNSHLNSIIIQAKSLNELTTILRKVTFHNPRLQYKPRYRPEPVAIQLNTMFNYATDCEIPSTFNQVILISPLPPTKQTLISLDRFNSNNHTDQQLDDNHDHHYQPPSHQYQQTEFHQPTQQPQQHQQQQFHLNEQKHEQLPSERLSTTVDLSSSTDQNQSFDKKSITSPPINALALFNAPQYDHVNKTFTLNKITFNNLSTGVYLFPYITIMWNNTSSELLTLHGSISDVTQSISSCTIDLCKSSDQFFNAGENTLSITEFLFLNPDYIKNGIKAFQRSNGFIIQGTSGVLSYMNALKHVQWLVHDEQMNLSRRCFNLSCEAMIQIFENDKFIMKKINSNAIQSEFKIDHEKSTQSPVIPSIVQHHAKRLSLRSKPRILNKRHINDLQPALHLQTTPNTWNNKGIILLISSSILAVLVILFVAIKRIHRVYVKSNDTESQARNFHMTSYYDIDALKQMYANQPMDALQNEKNLETSAEKLRNSRLNDFNSQTIIGDHFDGPQLQQSHDSELKLPQPIRITPNPFVNQSDMLEYQSKTVILDEKRYNAALNMSSSAYKSNTTTNTTNNNPKVRSPIVCNPTIQFYENPLRSDDEEYGDDDDDFQCTCSDIDDDTNHNHHDGDDDDDRNATVRNPNISTN
ncbi:unnamed protein product [Schistosoma turkestanicum]|nr:unnamed protein product [Schistosoma turkestanicum]